MRTRLTSIALALTMLLALAFPASANDVGKPGYANKISAGTAYSGCVDGNGSLWMWGRGQDGELGNGTAGNRDSIQSVPVKVMDGVVSVSTCDGDDDGGMFTAAVRRDGTLWMWGTNDCGELGNGGGGNAAGGWSKTVQTTPVKVMDGVASVSCGSRHTAAVKTDGSLWVWGVLYTEKGAVIQSAPVKVMDGVASVSCGDNCTAAIKTDGSLWTWGDSTRTGNGYKGNATYGYTLFQTTPMKVMDNVAAVSCGPAHTAAVTTDGSLWTWGDNGYGQLGIGGEGNETIDVVGGFSHGVPTYVKYTCQSVPVKVMDGVSSVCCGFGNTAVIKADGSLWTWGWNEYGQVGNGEAGEGDGSWDGLIQSTPVKVMDSVSAVSCSMTHMLASKTDGTVWTWGETLYGVPSYTASVYSRPVQVTTNAQAPAAGKFSDVSDNSYFAEPVKWALGKGITNGTSDTTFSPDQTCTVAQILTFLYRAKGSPKVTVSNPFTDVRPSDYYYSAALWAYQNGLVYGSVFDPSAPCKRSMVVTYLWKLAGSPSSSSPGYAPYTLSGKMYDGSIGSASFEAAIAKRTAIQLYHDRDHIAGSGANAALVIDREKAGTQYDLTLVIVRPGSKFTVNSGYYPYDFDEPVLDSVCYSLDFDGTLRHLNSNMGGGESFFSYEFFDRSYGGGTHANGTPIYGSGKYGGELVSLDQGKSNYLILYADTAAAAGMLLGESSFSDVPPGASYAQAVEWAVEKGITGGTGGTSFSPSGICTRGQIVTFLYRAFAK